MQRCWVMGCYLWARAGWLGSWKWWARGVQGLALLVVGGKTPALAKIGKGSLKSAA